MDCRKISRRAGGFRVAAVVGASTLAVGLLLGGAPTAWAAEVNPFADAGGFSVYVREDAVLGNSEVEGALAVGGELTTRKSGGSFPVLHYVAGTAAYTPPSIDGDPTRLLIGSFSDASGIVQVSGRGGTGATAVGYAKIIDQAAPFGFAERGGYTQFRDLAEPDSAAQGPTIDGLDQPWTASDPGRTFTPSRSSVKAYVENGQGFARTTACLAELAAPASSAHHVSVTDDGGKARLDLVAGVTNVLDYRDLFLGSPTAMASEITYSGAKPAIDTPVIVRVPAGTTSILASTFGDSGQYAHFVLWDLSALSGAVTIADRQGRSTRIDGSIYAPEVDLTATFGPLDGQLIARNLTTPDTAGELHAYFFTASLSCAETAPTTSAPSTSAPTTSAPTTSAPTTEAPTTPAPTEAPTTSAPTTAAPSSVPSANTSRSSAVGDASAGGAGPNATGGDHDELAYTGAGPMAAFSVVGITAVALGAALILLRRRA